MPEMLQNSEESRSLPEKVRERRSPAFPPHYSIHLWPTCSISGDPHYTP